MVSLDHLVNLVQLESLVLLDSLAHLDPRVTWEQLDPRAALVFKVLEVKSKVKINNADSCYNIFLLFR